MINHNISTLLPKIREFFDGQPVSKAWLFGSYSRGEETAESDVDILVNYDYSKATITLFTIGTMVAKLSELLDRQVDMVEEKGLLPFAKESVNRDRILIYERGCER